MSHALRSVPFTHDDEGGCDAPATADHRRRRGPLRPMRDGRGRHRNTRLVRRGTGRRAHTLHRRARPTAAGEADPAGPCSGKWSPWAGRGASRSSRDRRSVGRRGARPLTICTGPGPSRSASASAPSGCSVSGGTPGLVLIHSPLVGPSSWQPVAEELRVGGRKAVVSAGQGAAAVDAIAAERVEVIWTPVARHPEPHGG